MAVKTYGIHSPDFEESSRQEIYSYFEKEEILELDCETQGFDPHNSSLLCIQLGNAGNQFVISPDKLQEFKELLEEKELIGHNIKFDLKFLYHNNIWPSRVYDTFLAEGVIYCGIKIHKKALNIVAHTRLGIDLDKSVRENIWKEGLSKRVIEYSADDVKYLGAIREKQKIDLDEKDLHDALLLENQFVLALAYIEYCGFKLDKEKWKAKMAKDEIAVKEALRVLNAYVVDNAHNKFIKRQLDLFSSETVVQINWDSPKQCVEYFKFLKIPTEIVEGGEKKDSLEAKNIEKHAKEFPLVGLYLDYKEKQKEISTYGQSWLDQINPATGRLHTSFKQILDTSRLSSGGKNKKTGEEYKNFQNIPKDKETRACFVAEEGNVLIGCDYSGQEQVILANFSMDRNLLDFYDNGLADMHSFVAKKMYSKIPSHYTLEQVKDEYPDERYNAKRAGFAINYGGEGMTIAANNNVSLEEGDAIYNGYMSAFPGLKLYFNKSKKAGLENGYILFNNITRRKSYVYGYEKYLELKKEINSAFWDKYKYKKINSPSSPEFLEMKGKVKEFFQIKGKIEKKSLNFPIQGTAAEITKTSCTYFFNWIKKNNLQKIVLFANTIHDENVIDCPKDISKEASIALQDAMVKAGVIYCKRVPLKAIPEISPYWKK